MGPWALISLIHNDVCHYVRDTFSPLLVSQAAPVNPRLKYAFILLHSTVCRMLPVYSFLNKYVFVSFFLNTSLYIFTSFLQSVNKKNIYKDIEIVISFYFFFGRYTIAELFTLIIFFCPLFLLDKGVAWRTKASS